MIEQINSPYWIGHRERLRQRSRQNGLQALRPHEVIEQLLTYVVPRKDVAPIARALIGQLGSVEAIFRSNREALMAVPGVTRRMADFLLQTDNLIQAYRHIRQDEQAKVSTLEDAIRFISSRWYLQSPPQCWVIYCDRFDRILAYIKLADNLYMDWPLYATDIMENALLMKARYVYLVGYVGEDLLSLYPEEIGDVMKLAEFLRCVDVLLMDYILVNESGYLSASMEGDLTALRDLPVPTHLRERYVNGDAPLVHENGICLKPLQKKNKSDS